MVRIRRYILASACAFLLTCLPAWAQWPYNCVADLHNGSCGGSATLLSYSSDGKRARLLSCHHVFEDGVRNPWVKFLGSDTRYKCRVLGLDPRNDLSALEIQAPEGIKTPLCIRVASKSDEFVVAVGFPYYGKNKAHFSKGKFLGYRGNDCQFSAPVHSGYSGGALFAPDGAFIGVVWGYGESCSFATSNKGMLDFAARYMEVQR